MSAFTVPFDREDRAPDVFCGPLTRERSATTQRDRAGNWLRAAMVALAVLAATAATVSFTAQYRMVLGYRHTRDIAALQAAIPDVSAAVFACLGIALSLHGKRAVRARVLNVCAVGASIGMNLLAAGHGWKALAIYGLAPVSYAVTSDTLIGVLRAHTIARQKELDTDLADDESTPLAVVGKTFLYSARLVIAPRETLKGLRRALLNATPLPAEPQPEPDPLPILGHPVALPPGDSVPVRPAKTPAKRKPAKRSKSGPSKAQQFLTACEAKFGRVSEIPLDQVYRISKEIAPTVGLHEGSARTVLRKAIQNGSQS